GIPVRAGAGVNVDRAGVFHGGSHLIPVNPLGPAILEVRADGNGVAVAAHGQSPSELVVLPRIEGLHISLLRPLACRTHENVGPADGVQKVLLAGIDLAEFIFHGAGENGVAVVADGERASEIIAYLAVRGQDTRLLRPGPVVAREDVNGAFTAFVIVRAHA